MILVIVVTATAPDTSEYNRVDRAGLPLSAADLGWPLMQETPYVRLDYSRSPLLDYLQGTDGDAYWLHYTRYRSPWPFLLEQASDSFHDGAEWTEITGDPAWRGGEVWYCPDAAGGSYCAAYPGTVLLIHFEIPPTQAQIGVTLDALLT